MEGVVPAGQRRVHLQQEGERAAAARARQRPGPRQPRQAEPRGPPAHFARELLATQPPGRCLLGEAQLHRPGSSHGVPKGSGCVVSAPEERQEAEMNAAAGGRGQPQPSAAGLYFRGRGDRTLFQEFWDL